jgi:methanethiol S-methyltransferase
MSRAFAVLGGVLFAGSLIFFAVSYTWLFRSAGPWSAAGLAPLAVDIALFTLFALHHSIFARRRVRAWVERTVPAELERSTYVWIASVLLFIVCIAWQPVPGLLWNFSGAGAVTLRAAQLLGALLTVVAARGLDPLVLSGVRQVIGPSSTLPESEQQPTDDMVLDRGPYGFVRHPIYLGWFLMVWCAPVMNGTRLAFAAVSCLYLVIAIPFEERDLRRSFGDSYGRYAARVKWRLVPGLY